MAFGRLFADDEELGKKDDDFRPSDHRHHPSGSYTPSTSWLSGPRPRKRRLFGLLGVIVIIYLFIHNMPEPMGPVAERVDIRDPTRTIKGFPVAQAREAKRLKEQGILGGKASAEKEAAEQARRPPERPATRPALKSEDIPPILRGSKKTTDHYYDGKLSFFALPKSLNAIVHTMGYQEKNKNVAFAATNVESASRLIPVACEMAKYNRNYVHFAFLGRDAINLETLKEINGASKECAVYWHDGRPDESEISTDARMEYSVTSALYHIHQYIHPQVYIVDEDDKEEKYFVKGMRLHAAREGKSLIQLPPDAAEKMMWITRLDHSSLAAWDSIYIDILVHVPPGTSGSLIRLLKTIADADYFGTRTPHLTIELPPVIEPATQRFLDGFVWPPLPKDGSKHVSKVTLRKRVSTAHLSPLEASVRTVESFYSARPHDSHVLLLSTQAELSPLYYHYLFYHVLEYAYGFYAQGTYDQLHLAGIALDLPSIKLDGTPFTPPSPKEAENANEDSTEEGPFLWQVANTNAALYFGHKWQELHSYLAHRIATPPPEPSKKMVSAAFPAFAEPLLELMRARNYYLLFPHLPHGNTIATIHSELATLPEEYTPKPKHEHETVGKPLGKDVLYLEPVDPPQLLDSHHEGSLLSTSLVSLLPSDGDLPELHTLPTLSWDAYTLTRLIAVDQSNNYATNLRRNIGGCSTSHVARLSPDGYSADDLFCAKPSHSVETPDQPHEASVVPAVPATGEKAAKAGPAEDEKAQDTGPKSPSPKTPEHSGLELDTSSPPKRPANDEKKSTEAPNQKIPGELSKDASMQEIFLAEKEKARKQSIGAAASAHDEPKSPAEQEAIEQGQVDRKFDMARMAKMASQAEDMTAGSEEIKKAASKEKAAMQAEFEAHLNRFSKDKKDKKEKQEVKKERELDLGTQREMAEMASG